MLCEKCNINEATVLVQEIINGEKRERRLCAKCAEETYHGISFDALLKGLLNNFMNANANPQETKATATVNLLKCPMCGMTIDQIQKNGKVGCPRCYETFKPELSQAIKSIQGNSQHVGKFPKRSGTLIRKERKIDALKIELREKIREEKFEDAVRLRDEIRELEGRM
jgi:protein arginine kinase activator